MANRVLVVAAHPDDEVLGIGGTISQHVSQGDQVAIALIADCGIARYDEETIHVVRRSALEAAGRLGVSDVQFAGLEDQKLDTLPVLTITQWIEALLSRSEPEIVYTHHHGDINRDHRVVHEATLTAARPYAAPYIHRILCYETPSATDWAGPYPEDSFLPNVFVDVTAHMERKLHALSSYATELRDYPHPRSRQAIRERAAYWGSKIGVSAAEPFMLVREIQGSRRP